MNAKNLAKSPRGWAAVAWIGFALVATDRLGAAPQQIPARASSSDQNRAVLDRYCITCHNEKSKIANLMLDKLDVSNPPANAATWEKVIAKLRGRAMPPPKLPRPDDATYDALANYLETSIDAASKVNPGRPAVHRLNRAEYGNAVRDLLALDIDAASLLPADDSGYGFDNNGDVLSVSPALLERYVSAAWKISRMAVGHSQDLRPVSETYEVPNDLKQRDRMSEDLPLGSRGGMAVRHNFPADGEYVIKVRLLRGGNRANGDGNRITGVALKRQIDVRLDDERLKLLVFGGEQFSDPNQRREFEIHGDQTLEVRFAAKAGMHTIGVSFRKHDSSIAEDLPHGQGGHFPRGGVNEEPGLESVTIRGPYDAKGLSETTTRHRIFVCYPYSSGDSGSVIQQKPLSNITGEQECARKIISRLAHRAYRRPVASAELQALLDIYEVGKKEGGFEAGITMAVERILGGPEFLFRLERDPEHGTPGMVYRISEVELASRLSFFLWSSIPDDELLGLAEQGKLRQRPVLEQQVRRMLDDPRSTALVRNFFGQWLQLRSIEKISPDPGEFSDWDENLKDAFQQETELFLESMVREDHPLKDLLDARYTFLNERLARHYGIPNVYGSSFRRISLSDDTRAGLLGKGSVLTLTSYPTRTSIVKRGVWLLTNILATPPPPPPPNVPALKDRGEDGAIKPVRQAMEEHRANPVCASCHLRMDPLGFALENFNGIGQWRTTEGPENTPIDSTGELPDGTKFQGPIELRKILLSRPERFATTVIEALLTYGLGRGVEYYDEPVVRRIGRGAAPDYRWSSLIMGVVNSAPFQMRRTRQP